MELYKGLPLFDLSIVDEVNGVNIISLVDLPAIERNWVAFSKDAEIRFSLNEERKVITGPALIPEQPIFRRDDEGREFYVKFTKEAIEEIAVKFFADGNENNADLMHSEKPVDGVVYFESYLTDSQRGIAPSEFKDLPDGSWIVSAKINNDEVWNLIKDGTLRGFSIQGSMHVEEAKEKEINTIEELLEALKNYN